MYVILVSTLLDSYSLWFGTSKLIQVARPKYSQEADVKDQNRTWDVNYARKGLTKV